LSPRPHKRPFTFLALGDRGSRKGISTTWGAFYKAFPVEDFPDVRLIVKSRPGAFPYLNESHFPTGRVRFWKEDVRSMSDVYPAADCFVFPTYGEGWGLPPRECAAMGIPVIAPRHTGCEHDIDRWATRVIEKYAMKPAMVEPEGSQWYVPDLEETAAHMRWVYEHQEEAQNRAQKCAEWLHRKQTWSHAAKDFLAVLAEFIPAEFIPMEHKGNGTHG
jgi:hypothetical protein